MSNFWERFERCRDKSKLKRLRSSRVAKNCFGKKLKTPTSSLCRLDLIKNKDDLNKNNQVVPTYIPT
jgi:hypothetical protein